MLPFQSSLARARLIRARVVVYGNPNRRARRQGLAALCALASTFIAYGQLTNATRAQRHAARVNGSRDARRHAQRFTRATRAENE